MVLECWSHSCLPSKLVMPNHVCLCLKHFVSTLPFMSTFINKMPLLMFFKLNKKFAFDWISRSSLNRYFLKILSRSCHQWWTGQIVKWIAIQKPQTQFFMGVIVPPLSTMTLWSKLMRRVIRHRDLLNVECRMSIGSRRMSITLIVQFYLIVEWSMLAYHW